MSFVEEPNVMWISCQKEKWRQEGKKHRKILNACVVIYTYIYIHMYVYRSLRRRVFRYIYIYMFYYIVL